MDNLENGLGIQFKRTIVYIDWNGLSLYTRQQRAYMAYKCFIVVIILVIN